MHNDLPCNSGKGCDAPCCHVIVAWDRISYKQLETLFPELSSTFKIIQVYEVTMRIWHFVLPPIPIFSTLPGAMPEEEFRTYTEKLRQTMPIKHVEMRCVFLDQNGRCSVYEHRPKVCRDYPRPEQPECPRANRAA